MADAAHGARARRLAALAVASAAGLGVVYVATVRTRTGQRLDGTVLEHRFALTGGATERMRELLDAIAARSVLACCAALVLVALLCRRFVLASGVVVALAGSAVTARALKDHLLTRTDLGGFGGVSYNTFPSGHATVGMALALTLVVVVPTRLAWAATLVASVGASTVGAAVVATGGHRPSDAAGAYLATAAWFAACAAVVAWLERSRVVHVEVPERRGPAWAMPAAAAAALAVLVVQLVRSLVGPARRDDVTAGPYAVGMVALHVVGVGLVLATAWAQHGRARSDKGLPTGPGGYALGMTNGKMDETKGRAKEALGDLTDDERLQREGRDDQRAGKAKQAIDDVADKAREGVDKLKDKMDRR